MILGFGGRLGIGMDTREELMLRDQVCYSLWWGQGGGRGGGVLDLGVWCAPAAIGSKQFRLRSNQGHYEDRGSLWPPHRHEMSGQKGVHSDRNSNHQLRCHNKLSQCIHR